MLLNGFMMKQDGPSEDKVIKLLVASLLLTIVAIGAAILV